MTLEPGDKRYLAILYHSMSRPSVHVPGSALPAAGWRAADGDAGADADAGAASA